MAHVEPTDSASALPAAVRGTTPGAPQPPSAPLEAPTLEPDAASVPHQGAPVPLEAPAGSPGQSQAEPLLALRTDQLEADPSSAARARRVVREVLREADRTQWLEACELATTEVVSNAVLHAHTESTLTVAVHAGHVRVEVRDASPVLPVQRDYSAQATTGRGLALVAALADEHGLADVGPAGKTVWFRISGDPEQQSEEELLDAWADADWDVTDLLERAPSGAGDVATVWLLGLPPTLWLAARQHHDAIIRELVLHLAEHDDVEVDVAAADAARVAVSTAVVVAVEPRGTAVAADAQVLGTGLAPLDLPLEVPADLAAAFSALQHVLDTAERLAREGRLLAHPALPEVVAVRDWVCEQVVTQLAGGAPTAWAGADQERFTTSVHDRAGGPDLSDAVVTAVRESGQGVVAADEANRVLAVSRPLAALLGWDVDDLVGRRVVSLVPARLREAHVAGFARHLATGEAHILDVPLTVPVLRADGQELTCRLLVQHVPVSSGRPVYLGWIDEVVDER